MKRISILFTIITCTNFGHAQLFGNDENMKLVQKGVDYIYNVQPDSAEIYIDLVEQKLPKHPATSMMRALNVLWTNIPVVTIDSVFTVFSGHLEKTIEMAQGMDDGEQENPEAIFFEMSARGLLAEYYADDGQYMKALNEAGKAYYLVKRGFEMVDEVPEFLLTTGVYNYFREKYPEKHPIYKPLLWFFKSGDIELGIQQMHEATEKAVLSNVEAYVYISYVYLRYENKPKLAQSYLKELTSRYPRNPYIKAKYLESLTPEDDFKRASLKSIKELAYTERPYYKMAGQAFWGLYDEKVKHDTTSAIRRYQLSIESGEQITGHGEYYRSLAYLGLGRIYTNRKLKDQAIYHLNKAISLADTEDVKVEAKDLLDKVE